jgi:hypothetical protein
LCRRTFFLVFSFSCSSLNLSTSSSLIWTNLAMLRIVKGREGNYTRKQSHVIDILASEDMENMSLCISRYLTLYYIIKLYINTENVLYLLNTRQHK